MKYDNDTALSEILHRSSRLKKKNEQNRLRILCASSVSLFVLLVLSIGIVFRDVAPDRGQSVYGSFMLPTNSGGYVLAALIAFIAGVVVTMVIRRNRGKKEREDKKENG